MPTGQPDFRFAPQTEAEVVGDQMPTAPEVVETTADRLIREAMEAGEFEDLPGTGRPIPGAGRIDDDLWWVRSWMERNRARGDQEPSSSE